MALTDKQMVILGGGAVAALVILHSRGASASTAKKPGLLQGLFPKAKGATATGLRPTGTMVATGGGTRTAPLAPATVQQRPIGTAAQQYPNWQTAVAAQGVQGLFQYLAAKQAQPSGQKPPVSGSTSGQNRAGGGSGSPSGGGASGGGGGAGAQRNSPTRPMGSASDNTPTPDGFYDDRGNWVQTDVYGNITDGSGYYDDRGNYTPYTPISQDFSSSGFADIEGGLPGGVPLNADLIAAARDDDAGPDVINTMTTDDSGYDPWMGPTTGEDSSAFYGSETATPDYPSTDVQPANAGIDGDNLTDVLPSYPTTDYAVDAEGAALPDSAYIDYGDFGGGGGGGENPESDAFGDE